MINGKYTKILQKNSPIGTAMYGICLKCNKTRPLGGQAFIFHANYLAKALTLRAKRDFLRFAAFL